MNELPAAVSLPRQCLIVLRLVLGVCLGAFVLAQAWFLLVYNISEAAGRGHEVLLKHREAWLQSQKGQQPESSEGDPNVWTALTRLPLGVGPLLKEWADNEKESKLALFKKKLDGPLDRYARLAAQEQGWSLFAPNTVDWTCLLRVELKWSDDPEPLEERHDGKAVIALAGGTAMPLLTAPPRGAPEKLILPSDNQPRDITRYFRFGHFRVRRFESKFETPLRKSSADEKEEDYRFRWQERVKEKVHGEQREIALYLNWKLRKFLEANPDMPEPRQVILHSRTWTIPKPPGPRPWMWQEDSDEPMCRWRPHRQFPRADGLELYLHSDGRFENNKATRWPLTLHPAKPGPLD